MKLKSMTGYARLKRATSAGEATVTIKSVNHRSLDLQVMMPAALDPFEAGIRAAVKRRLHRGRVDLRVSLERAAPAAGSEVDRELLDAYVAAYRAAAREYGLAGEPDLNAALRLPGMMSAATAVEFEEGFESELALAVDAAIDLLDEFREREGAALALDIAARERRIAQLASEIAPLRAAAVEALRARIDDRLGELALKLDPQRLAQEAAVLADRSDIAEEIARLVIHAAELRRLIENGGEAGKKLDFLLQEMNREVNTILAKSANAGEAGMAITHIGLELKAEIEKIREQSLNIE
jgi:uncharacterized protein (TIGR00255 family)